MGTRQYWIRLPDDVLAQVDAEVSRRSTKAGVKVSRAAVMAALVVERLKSLRRRRT